MHPERIGPYRIDQKIGSGGMGNVYHGVHAETGQEVAVKVLPASMAREEGFVLRFSREIEALKKVSSRYIVKLFDNGITQDESYYYSMQYVDGETLTNLISRRRRIPWLEVIEMSVQICSALKAAHNAGVIHRDLKPSNLMVAKDGTVMLTDFGVAHLFSASRLTRTGGIVGTAEYMSPEQARGQRTSNRSDLYSLGAVMYTMLTGRPPFRGKTASDVLHQHQFGQFDKPSLYVPDVPRPLEEIVCTLLEKKANDRIPDAFVLMKKLEQVRNRIEFTRGSAKSSTLSDNEVRQPSGSPSSLDDMLAEQRPGPATLVRDLVRDEASNQRNKSAVGRFFDNTLVLIIMLGLLIASGFYFSRNQQLDPRQELQRARTILAGEPGTAWLRARNDIVTPLIESQTFRDEADTLAELNRMVSQVDQYEFCRSLKVGSPSDGTERSEVQRLIKRAFEHFASGETVVAQSELNAVRAVIAERGDSPYLQEFLNETARNWNSEQNLRGARAVLTAAMKTARAKPQTVAGLTEAVVLLESVLFLYRSEAGHIPELESCRLLLVDVQETLDQLSERQ